LIRIIQPAVAILISGQTEEEALVAVAIPELEITTIDVTKPVGQTRRLSTEKCWRHVRDREKVRLSSADVENGHSVTTAPSSSLEVPPIAKGKNILVLPADNDNRRFD
jgi:hypothetical protein